VPRAAILDPRKLGPLLRAIDDCPGNRVVRDALRLLPLLFVRPGELRQAEWCEFDFNECVWSIPANRTKMQRPLSVPLAPQALTILVALRECSYSSELVFPSLRNSKKCLSDGTLNAALRACGYPKEEVTPHGFRATASTLLNESGKWHRDAIERQLGHVENDKVRAAYARGEHWEMRVLMMTWWAGYLSQLKHSEPVLALVG
jgi:integrase